VNFTLDITDELLFRAAASETFIRPALTDIAYKRTVSLNEFKYRDGNPDLKPTYADQWEVGLEFIVQVPFARFHDVLHGFGVNANYTTLDNSLTGTSDLGIPTPPEGLADETYNVTFYYEDDVFDARVSYNYKDKYVEYIERDMYPVYRDAYGQYDVSLGYRINETFKVTLEGINITDEATKGYTMDPAFPTMYEFSGRRVSLGLRGNF